MTQTNKDTFLKCVESINQLLKETEHLLNNLKEYPNHKLFWEGQIIHFNKNIDTISKILEVEVIRNEK